MLFQPLKIHMKDEDDIENCHQLAANINYLLQPILSKWLENKLMIVRYEGDYLKRPCRGCDSQPVRGHQNVSKF